MRFKMLSDIVCTKVNYFIDYWLDFTNLNGIEQGLTNNIVYNPRELFREFAYEIEIKELKNKDNKQIFIKYINQFSQLKIESINFLEPTITLITRQFQKPNFPYLLHLLKQIDILLDKHPLGLNCVDELQRIITDESRLNELIQEKIKILIKIIFFELINKKYSLENIRKTIENIFNKYEIKKIKGQDIIDTKFPHNIKIKFKTKIDSEEFRDYQNKIKNLIDNLTLENRILALKNYLQKEPEKLLFIFQIKGIKGDIDISLGKVRIYNPANIKLIITENLDEKELREYDETFGAKDYIYCNGAVTLDVVDQIYGRQEAQITLSEAIDILTTHYRIYEVAITINTAHIITSDADGNTRGYNFEFESEAFYHNQSKEIQQSTALEKLQNYYESIQVKKLPIDKKILESLHWKRKAIESSSPQDQILWYWISLENLVGDTNTIFNVISQFLAIAQLSEFAWKHFNQLCNLVGFSGYRPVGYYQTRLNIRQELPSSSG